MSSSEFAPKLTCEAFSGAMANWPPGPPRQNQCQEQSHHPTQLCEPVCRTGVPYRSTGIYSTKVLFSLPTAPLNSSHTLQGIFQPLPQQLLTACMASERVGAHGAYYGYARNHGLNLLKSPTGNYSCWILKRTAAALSPCRQTFHAGVLEKPESQV